jgi:hypothetical protein
MTVSAALPNRQIGLREGEREACANEAIGPAFLEELRDGARAGARRKPHAARLRQTAQRTAKCERLPVTLAFAKQFVNSS